MEDAAHTDERRTHWDEAYAERGPTGVSWFQAEPRMSLELIEALEVPHRAAVLDVGGGASLLVDRLVTRGFSDVTILDLSAEALRLARERVAAPAISWVVADVLDWRPARRYGLWHDRAVLHFLVDAGARQRYLESLRRVLAPGGAVVVGAFAEDGPQHCSGLPVLRFAADELAALLGEDFAEVARRREEHVTPGGVVQPFTWLGGRLGA